MRVCGISTWYPVKKEAIGGLLALKASFFFIAQLALCNPLLSLQLINNKKRSIAMELLNKLNELDIRLLPSNKGAVLPTKLEDNDTGDVKDNGQIASIDVIATLSPLLPSGFRITLLPTSRRYPDTSYYIGKERTLSDSNKDVLDKVLG